MNTNGTEVTGAALCPIALLRFYKCYEFEPFTMSNGRIGYRPTSKELELYAERQCPVYQGQVHIKNAPGLSATEASDAEGNPLVILIITQSFHEDDETYLATMHFDAQTMRACTYRDERRRELIH